MTELTESEREVLAEFRTKISDLTLNELQESDYFLIRWLRARENDLEKARSMLSDYLEYRKRENIDEIFKWEAPEQFKTLAPYKVIGKDSGNCPVLFAPTGLWNFREIVSLGLAEDFIRYVDKILEEMEFEMINQKGSNDLPVTQFVYISDMDKLSMIQFANMQVVDMLMKVTKKFEAYHPETLKRFYAVNAGRAFSALFSLVKPIMGPRTVDKFVLYANNSEKFKVELLKGVPAAIVPPQYGGTNTESLDLVNVVVDDEDDDIDVYMCVTVPAGDKLILNFGVDEGNSEISWAFQTDTYDISFGVTRDGKAYIENKKVDSHKNMQEGSITCDHPGDYIFTFDNTYSRIRTKKLSYRINIKSPSGSKQV